jgi:hypothetical protein
MAKNPMTMLIKYKAPAILAQRRGDDSAIRSVITAALILVSPVESSAIRIGSHPEAAAP